MNINKSLEMIKELSDANGISGFEDEVLLVGRKYASEICNITEDSLRNLYLNRKKNTGNKPVIMIDGHSDELGFIIQAIKPDGTMLFLPIGGWVQGAVAGHKVRVRNSEGKYISGVIGTKPPHFLSDAEKSKPLEISNLTIDVGASSIDEVKNDFKIEIGAPVVPDVDLEIIETSRVLLGKAFDCRLGCAAVIDVMKNLENENLNVDIVGTFSSQEEIGTRGSKVTAERVKPDIAIVFEGTPADDTIKPAYEAQSVLKKGCQIRHFDKSMLSNPRFTRFAKNIAIQNKITFQETVRSGGGTNGGSIHLSGNGVPTIVLGVPTRYAHTHHGYAAIFDYESTVMWATEIIKALDKDTILSF